MVHEIVFFCQVGETRSTQNVRKSKKVASLFFFCLFLLLLLPPPPPPLFVLGCGNCQIQSQGGESGQVGGGKKSFFPLFPMPQIEKSGVVRREKNIV